MHILFLSPWFPYPPENGSKIRIYNLIKTLSKHHNVRLISFVREGEHIDPEGLSGICRLEATIPWSEFSPYSWKSLAGFLSPIPRSVIDTYSPQMTKQIQLSLAKEYPDLIVASEENTAVYAGRKWDIPCIMDEMQLGLLSQLWSTSSSPWLNIRKKLYWAKVHTFTRYLVNRYDAYTVASEKEQELLSRLLDGKGCAYVVPNGVDLDYYQPSIAKAQPYTLIYNGALTFNANLDAMSYFLHEIFPSIRAQVPEVTLKITGSIQGVNLSRLPLDGHVKLTGFLPDIRPSVAGAWACVVPLRLGGGTRLKVLEAMALGTPVVATSKAIEGLDITPEKHVLLADTPEIFSKQIIRLLKDNHLRDELAKNGRELVENNYGWDEIGSLFEHVIETVMKESKRV